MTSTSSIPGLIGAIQIDYASPAPTGTLRFTPLPNQNGSATVTVTVMDDGGVANGGDNSVSVTFDVTVNAVNDAPVASNETYGLPRNVTSTIPPGNGVLRNAFDVDFTTNPPQPALTASLIQDTATGTLVFVNGGDGGFMFTPDRLHRHDDVHLPDRRQRLAEPALQHRDRHDHHRRLEHRPHVHP